MVTLDMHILPQCKINTHALFTGSTLVSALCLETINTREPLSPRALKEAKGRLCLLLSPQLLPGPMCLAFICWLLLDGRPWSSQDLGWPPPMLQSGWGH